MIGEKYNELLKKMLNCRVLASPMWWFHAVELNRCQSVNRFNRMLSVWLVHVGRITCFCFRLLAVSYCLVLFWHHSITVQIVAYRQIHTAGNLNMTACQWGLESQKRHVHTTVRQIIILYAVFAFWLFKEPAVWRNQQVWLHNFFFKLTCGNDVLKWNNQAVQPNNVSLVKTTRQVP